MPGPEPGPYGSTKEWSGHHDPGGLESLVRERRTIGADEAVLAVTDPADRLVGDVGYRRLQTGPSEASWAWQIGVMILLACRGRGYGAAAQRALAAYLFETTTRERVEADTDVHNLAEQRALGKAGSSREGVRRRSQWRAGAWHDTVCYAVVRGEL